MNKTIYNLLSVLFFVGISIWLGGKLIVGNIIFMILPPDNNFLYDQSISEETLLALANIFGMGCGFIFIAYSIAFAAGLIIFISERKNLKKKGWLFMAGVTFFLASIYEIWEIINIIKLNTGLKSNNPEILFGAINAFIVEYFQSVTIRTLSTLSLLLNISTFVFLIAKPLDEK